MLSSGSMRAQIGTLIIATSGIQLANGFFNTLISLRVAIEDFAPTMAGLVLSSYFAGFTLGALRCGRIIERVGHIRAYAAFAGLVVAATAAMPLLVGPPPWLVLRAVIGFGCAGLFITTESWLNAKAQPAERGRIFSIRSLSPTRMTACRPTGPTSRESVRIRSRDQAKWGNAEKVESLETMVSHASVDLATLASGVRGVIGSFRRPSHHPPKGEPRSHGPADAWRRRLRARSESARR